MKHSIPISNEKEYSLEELSDIMRVLLADADDAYFEVEALQIPRKKLFQIVRTVLTHISEASLGEFELITCSPTNYQLIYRENKKHNRTPIEKTKKAQQRTVKKEVETEVLDTPMRIYHRKAAVTALRLEEIVGELPNYAKYEPYATLIAGIKAKIKKDSE